MTLWEVDVLPASGQADTAGQSLAAEARDLGLGSHLKIAAAHGFLLSGNLDESHITLAASGLLADPIVERVSIGRVGDHALQTPEQGLSQIVYVLPKPGVMDPVAQSTLQALQDLSLPVDQVRTLRKYWLSDLDDVSLNRICNKLLANDSIEQVVVGPLKLDKLDVGTPYEYKLVHVPIRNLDDEALKRLSREGQLYLALEEMQTIQRHFRELNREPTDIELETIAQTWSEHCSHKTLAGRIAYEDEKGKRQFTNMLKETIFAATDKIRTQLGKDDWCVKVFKDNAGIVKFDDEYHVVFKVETHNHPSAIEPYGGSNTGIGGVIRDPMGTGLGAKPFCNTDVFCFAPPDTDPASLPPGVLHPRRVMKGVVSGVRDYGNRMGIPTVNGAVYFDKRYLGNPLVYCGNAGLLPVDKADKQPRDGDWIVAIGGRTGRDGIHGATFSSAELTSQSESISGGSVQIGNAITEKMVLDVLMQARDEGLFTAVTDCGAGGFSSAVGEMGESIGAEVWLDRAPLKYAGLSYTEIWISEAQERMVMSVPQKSLERLKQVCASEGVEASVIGQFVPTGMLRLMYKDKEVGILSMHFLHDGRPPTVRSAVYKPQATTAAAPADLDQSHCEAAMLKILGSLNVASKHWIVRQYDHEVQGGSVIKPFVGPSCQGPSDAAVVRPRLSSQRGVVISCGMNPAYGDFDPYHMAASAIDEAVRNAVAVGADPKRIAILDNFCWGNTDRPETLGTLVRAALACHDLALAWQTPFISGKDSLNNEFTWMDAGGVKQSIAIPSSLLISAMGQMADCRKAVTMDLKTPSNDLYLIGTTKLEFGGSHLFQVLGLSDGQVPQVDAAQARSIFTAVHAAIEQGLIRSCHDLSEGGLAIALAEMSFGGHLGAEVDVSGVSARDGLSATSLLFAESNSRFVIEASPTVASKLESVFAGLPLVKIGRVTESDKLTIRAGALLCDRSWAELKDAWYRPLDWQ